MKQLCTYLFICAFFFDPFASFAGNRWQQANVTQLPAAKRPVHATKYRAYTTDEAALKRQLFNLSNVPAEGRIIELPMPDGTIMNFRIWQSPMMPDRLASRYPELRTFTGEAIDNPTITAKLDFTTFGFHAMIFEGSNISFIDPYGNEQRGIYIAHY